ncbi:MAG: prephenate dehydratase [Pseudomonadales bacterium]
MASNDDLAALRVKIDALDQRLQTLISERAEIAEQVAAVKLGELLAQGGSESEVEFYRPEREAQVLGRVMERNEGPLADAVMAHIFREIISACLALEKPTEVAYFGPEGTYTHQAALKHFGQSAVVLAYPSISSVFSQVEDGHSKYGVVPVENSTEGMVTHTLDSFAKSRLKICGEVELRIHHQLLIASGSNVSALKTVCGHQQALAQCQTWLSTHWPHLEQEAVSSNATAAQMAASDPSVAAIASSMAAELYGLHCVASNIEDLSDNTTRFLVLASKDVPPSGDDKTSVIVATRNKPGALFKLLEPFDREGIMLTRIDTRPSPSETWAYLFFIEFEGHQTDPKIAKILPELEEHSVMVKLLGSYPRAPF